MYTNSHAKCPFSAVAKDAQGLCAPSGENTHLRVPPPLSDTIMMISWSVMISCQVISMMTRMVGAANKLDEKMMWVAEVIPEFRHKCLPYK